MGTVASITATTFPKQGPFLGKRTKVIFHHGAPELWGTIVRDDYEHPWRTIIQLDDGRYILSVECQCTPERGEDEPWIGVVLPLPKERE